MADAQLTRLSLVETAELIRRRALSPVELAEAVLARIAALNPGLNAFTTLVAAEDVLAAARAAEQDIARGNYRGPLHGIPVGVKDLLDTGGLRTTYGSGMFADHIPAADGGVPERLRAAGAILTGKTATHEFGRGLTTNNYFFGPTRNPWNPEHVPGGSSGGAAAAAAAALGPFQVGTDGAGSTRIPAAWCGVVGYKPTLGLVSNRGNLGSGDSSYSTPGALARSVRDAALVTQALAGFDSDYVYSRPGPVPDLLGELDAGIRGLRVGVSPDFLEPAPDLAVRAAYEATLRRLADLGAEVREVRMPHHELVMAGVSAMFAIDADTQFDILLGDRPRAFGPVLQHMLDRSIEPDAAGCAHAQRNRQLVGRDYAVAFCDLDVLVSPTVPFPAPRIDLDESRFVLRCVPYTGAANLAGLPAVTIPAGFVDGLPVGVQVIAPAGADPVALRVAYALEQAAVEHRVQAPPER